MLKRPIQPAQELSLPFGDRSQWLQPWRAYLDTPRAATVTNGLGINFNVSSADAPATAAALARAGFHRARVEIGWGNIDPDNPNRLSRSATPTVRALLSSLFRHHIRPLILLNANEGEPTGLHTVSLNVVAPALAGTRTVILAPASAAQVVPGRTGFNSLTGGFEAAAVMITGIRGLVATLSAPLPRTLLPGTYSGSTLAFAPFTDPATPGFSPTLSGWLSYVKTVAGYARSLGHGDRFDVEVWNELSFGSDFLNINNYYSPPIDPRAPTSGSGDAATNRAILTATANLIHSRFPGVQVGDGFDDEIPWPAGSTEPPGVQIDKHYYAGERVFPQANIANGNIPIDWLGRPFGTRSSSGVWTDRWVPSYTVDFPEYYLTGIQTETVIRDLTPLPERIYKSAHGRFTHPRGAPPPKLWMTEYNLPRPTNLTPVQTERFQAKVALRYLLSFINKGLGLVTFYAAEGSGWGLLPDSFFKSLDAGRKANAGLTMAALGRMTRHINSDRRMRKRSIKLIQIATTDKRNVFNGQGRYPPLRNLDVAAFFPFQEATHRFVFAAYVMTRDLARRWQRPGPREYDMPPAPYRFVIGNVDGCQTKLSAYDPLAGRTVKVRRTGCSKHTLTLQADLTDSPILIQASGA